MTAQAANQISLIKDFYIQDDVPFANDLLQRQALANMLQNYVKRLKVGATLAIDAEWGVGKTWFVKNWKAQLAQNDFKVILINAFEQDYIEDPFLTIAMEIENCLRENTTDTLQLRAAIGSVGRAFLPHLPLLICSLMGSIIGSGLLGKAVADALADIQDRAGEFGEHSVELLNAQLKEHLAEKIEAYDNAKQSLAYFKQILGECTAKLEQPLVFIIDELDRCKPEYAIRLIERIKHFFDISNVVFVLSINKRQFERSIDNYYGFAEHSNYLEKFIDFTIHLKNKDQKVIYQNLITSYFEQLGLNHIANDYIEICKIFMPNARQTIRIINKFALLSNDAEGPELNLFLFIVLIYLELKLLDHYTTESLCQHFIKSVLASDKDESDKHSILRDFSNKFKTKNFSVFFAYLFYLKFPADTPPDYARGIYRFSRNPNHNRVTDVVAQWVDYVHLVME